MCCSCLTVALGYLVGIFSQHFDVWTFSLPIPTYNVVFSTYWFCSLNFTLIVLQIQCDGARVSGTCVAPGWVTSWGGQ